MRWREFAVNLGVALLCVVAFLVMLSIVGCAAAPHRGKVQQRCETGAGGAVTCTCTGAP
jgi:hypothetical protein